MSADAIAGGQSLAQVGGAGPAAGVIHDRGYRRYAGERVGRLQIVRALCWHSFRSAFGIGRGAKAKIVPIIAFAAMCLPAVINTISVARGGDQVVQYGTYTFALRVVVMTIFIAAQAPELVSRDLRSRVLPLYFSRPLRRGDYPLAKLVAFGLACLAMVELPLLLLYLGNMISIGSGHAAWLQTEQLAGGLAVGLALAVLLAAVGLALASLSGRRAYATGAVAIFCFLTWTLTLIIYQISGHAPGPAAGPVTSGQRLAGLINPFTVVDGVRQWFGGTAAGPLSPPGGYGAAYGVVFVVLLAASLTVFAARYRKVQ
jgi:ABC-2 type transport system permease protein